MIKREEVLLDQLLLDEQNPRIGDVESQSAAIESIVLLRESHFANMMKSIKEHGLDPGDSLYAISSPDDEDDYIVLEGNRRLAALKVLAEPSVVLGTELPEKLQKKLAEIAEGFSLAEVEPIRCAIFDDRAEANEWIRRRHSGNQDGEGRIDWGPLEKRRFEGDRTVLDVMEFAERNWHDGLGVWKDVEESAKSNSSNLSRFLESKAVKDWIGLSLVEEGGITIPRFSRPSKQVFGVVAQILGDLRDGQIDSRRYNTSEEIAQYLDALPETLRPKSKLARPEKFAGYTIAGGTGPKKPTKKPSTQPEDGGKKPTTRAKPPRKTLAPSAHRFKQPPSAKGQRLVYEASKLKLDLALASAYVFRAFLEYTINEYMARENLPVREADKNKRMQELSMSQKSIRVLDHLIAAKKLERQDQREIRRILSDRSDPVSIQALNDYQHSRFRIPTADALRAGWDSAEPLFIAVFGAP